MNPERKRKIRLVIALTAAVLLATGLVYTSLSASSEVSEPSDLLAGAPSGTYDLTGLVVGGSIQERASALRFEVADRDDPSQRIPVRYSGLVPDPFRAGREVIVTGSVERGTFLAERDSLITKCPSKFSEAAEEYPDNVIVE